jgi:hypothetical protein
MYNRRERRRIEKELGITKLIKEGPREIREQLLKQRQEESLALQREWREQQEAIAREEEIQRYAKTLQLYTDMGYTVEEAEAKILEITKRDEERAMRKRKRRTT